MRHHKRTRTLGRVTRQRTALLRSLTRSLIAHERIQTTEAKAKEVRPFVEKLLTLGRVDTVARRRLVKARLGGNDKAMQKIFNTLSPKYQDRQGGYTRIIKLTPKGHGAIARAFIEFV